MTTTRVTAGPQIEAIAPSSARPRWSVMIPTYNCAGYLEEALASVLAQDLGSSAMQIEVLDDASSDDPQTVVKRIAGERVGFFRQPKNVGVTANLTNCIRRARGTIVHILHGDDAVAPGFYAKMDEAFARKPEIGLAFCRHVFIDAEGRGHATGPLERETSGILDDAAAYLAAEQRIMTPSVCVRREVYEKLGGFLQSLHCAEDWEMWVRIAASYPVWYETAPLACYRMHESSNTGRHVRSGADIPYTAEAIEVIAGHLPPTRAQGIAEQARKTYARSALAVAEKAFARGDLATARAQFLGAFALSHSAAVLAAGVATLLRAIKARLGSRDAAAMQ